MFSVSASITPSIPTGWTFLNCYNDIVGNRALTGFYGVTQTNTPVSCLATCKSKGFAYAGVEYGSFLPFKVSPTPFHLM